MRAMIGGMAAGPLLVCKGRTLTPRSRFRYRLARLRTLGGIDDVGLVAIAVRLVTLPYLTAIDAIAWPFLRRALGDRSWWVVELRFRGPDADLVRLAEAATHDEAEARRAELLAARTQT